MGRLLRICLTFVTRGQNVVRLAIGSLLRLVEWWSRHKEMGNIDGHFGLSVEENGLDRGVLSKFHDFT